VDYNRKNQKIKYTFFILDNDTSNTIMTLAKKVGTLQGGVTSK